MINDTVFGLLGSPLLIIVEMSDSDDIVAYTVVRNHPHNWLTFPDDVVLVFTQIGSLIADDSSIEFPVIVVHPFGYDITPIDEHLARIAVEKHTGISE